MFNFYDLWHIFLKEKFSPFDIWLPKIILGIYTLHCKGGGRDFLEAFIVLGFLYISIFLGVDCDRYDLYMCVYICIYTHI